MIKPKILVIRNDKLGDFMLAWPALSLLKNQYLEADVTVLIPSYTKPIAELCPWIDHIITDDEHYGVIRDARFLANVIKINKFDVSISLFSEMRTSLALWLSRIKNRVGPATKLAKIFLNNSLKQKRSLSLKPEYEYNTDLIRHYITSNGHLHKQPLSPPYLRFEKSLIHDIKHTYMDENNIDPASKLIFIHAGSGGSAINLSLKQYADLAKKINQQNKVYFVLTAGPDELDIANQLSLLMKDIHHSVFHSTDGLVNFTQFIDICDLFISGSTGPLHIAGALDIPTAAFYPARRSATPLRWQTINSPENRISFAPETYKDENDMRRINIEECAKKIAQHYHLK